MTELSILSLDTATTTGYAHLHNGRITFDSVSFKRKHGRKTMPDDHVGHVFNEYRKWLVTVLLRHEYELVIAERPGRFPSMVSSQVALGMRGITFASCAAHNIPVVEYSPRAIKKYATGTGNADKQMMVDAAYELSGERKDDNAADAYLMLRYHIELTKDSQD